MTTGSKVLIEGETSWGVGIVEEIRAVEHLPHIEGAPSREIVQSIMGEMRVERVAVISCGTFVFCALEADGSWWDLQGQRLSITLLEEALEQEATRARVRD